MSKKTRALWWCCSGGVGLLLVVVLLVFLHAPGSNSDPPSNSDPSAAVLEQSVTNPVKVQEVAVKMGPTLPPVDFPPGSVEDACGLNEYPPHAGYFAYEKDERLSWANNPFDAEDNFIALESEECRSALEKHMTSINPVLWVYDNRAFEFVVLKNPLTFDRIFADPAGDLIRVQNALSRPECLLKPNERNWELKETCHAEAFLNYALINRFCYEPHLIQQDVKEYRRLPTNWISVRNQTYYTEWDKPTPEQDRVMWKESLENAWVRQKCKELDPNLEFTPEQHPELYELVMYFEDQENSRKKEREHLIEIAARLGDEAAGLTSPFGKKDRASYFEEGYKFGRFSELLSSAAWKEVAAKREPSAERFQKVLSVLTLFDAHRLDPRDEIEFDWEAIVQHLCTPPYFERTRATWVETVEDGDHLSCQEVVHDIRQGDIKFRPLLDALDKFEQVAIELDVYD